MQAGDRYARNKEWGEQKEREAAALLQQAYSEILVRQTDITTQVVLQEDMRLLPAQPNLQILTRGTQNLPLIAWCETSRKTYEEFTAYRNALYVKLKTLNAMQSDHYLIKPLVRRVDDVITDIIAIRRPDMEKTGSINQTNIHRTDGLAPVGSGWTATVRVKSHSDLIRNGQKTAETFLESLLVVTPNPRQIAVHTAFDDIFS